MNTYEWIQLISLRKSEQKVLKNVDIFVRLWVFNNQLITLTPSLGNPISIIFLLKKDKDLKLLSEK